MDYSGGDDEVLSVLVTEWGRVGIVALHVVLVVVVYSGCLRWRWFWGLRCAGSKK